MIPPDQIALPDLNPVAMENWGLVTYQEGSLLYEEGVSSLLHKEAIASIIAHELAHQVRGRKRKLFCVLPAVISFTCGSKYLTVTIILNKNTVTCVDSGGFIDCKFIQDVK